MLLSYNDNKPRSVYKPSQILCRTEYLVGGKPRLIRKPVNPPPDNRELSVLSSCCLIIVCGKTDRKRCYNFVMWNLRFCFLSERNPSPGPGLNPRIVGPMASTELVMWHPCFTRWEQLRFLTMLRRCVASIKICLPKYVSEVVLLPSLNYRYEDESLLLFGTLVGLVSHPNISCVAYGYVTGRNSF
jgi:hypothetical protein